MLAVSQHGCLGLKLQQQRKSCRTPSGSSTRGSSSRGSDVRAAASASRSELASNMKQMRASMLDSSDEKTKVFMAGLRGSNIDDSDFASSGQSMRFMEVEGKANGDDKLPLAYEPASIADFWGRRPVSVTRRIMQLMGIAGGFLSRLAWDAARGQLAETEIQRAVELREIVTSLGPAYIKLGQALSIRPDILSPGAMTELQRLCDKVPSFDNGLAMAVLEEELGRPYSEVYSELTPEPIAAASLGQVYKGKLRSTGDTVAVKVQRPGVLETVTVDLFIIRSIGLVTRDLFPKVVERVDIVALLDEWAERFFEELDYVKEGENGTLFIEQMRVDLPQVVVPRTFADYTTRRVLTTSWLEGEKLSQSKADDVSTLVNVGVVSYLKQLLDTGFFHADPHPGNLIRTPDGRLAILDFGLVCEIEDNVKYGLIEAIAHLIHRDYEAIVKDFVTLGFIPEGTNLAPILPVLSRVFDNALAGGGAKGINFQDLSADLAQITFDFPFRIPPFFALVIRAISVLEGIALVGDPEFAIIDEAYPYIARRLLTDPHPRLREALRYMVYGKSGIFDADRFIDLLSALEDYQRASTSAMGSTRDAFAGGAAPLPSPSGQATRLPGQTTSTPPSSSSSSSGSATSSSPQPQFPFPFPFPFPAPQQAPNGGWALSPFSGGGPGGGMTAFGFPFPGPIMSSLLQLDPLGRMLSSSFDGSSAGPDAPSSGSSSSSMSLAPAPTASTREALRFLLSPEGTWFRTLMMDELVRSVDALTRDQAHAFAERLGLAGVQLPVLLPEDRAVVDNVFKIVDFLGGGGKPGQGGSRVALDPYMLFTDLMPVLPTVATEILPELTQKLTYRVLARLVREVYTDAPATTPASSQGLSV